MYNFTSIVGTLGRDPEERHVGAGSVTTMSVAVNSGKREDSATLWLRVVVWNLEPGHGLRKGDRVQVTGFLKSNQWTDKDGNKKETIELTATSVAKVLRTQRKETARDAIDDDMSF